MQCLVTQRCRGCQGYSHLWEEGFNWFERDILHKLPQERRRAGNVPPALLAKCCSCKSRYWPGHKNPESTAAVLATFWSWAMLPPLTPMAPIGTPPEQRVTPPSKTTIPSIRLVDCRPKRSAPGWTSGFNYWVLTQTGVALSLQKAVAVNALAWAMSMLPI